MQGIPSSATDRAASPVIAVILMVAVTVLLAATIGTFVLDYGDEVDTNPQASVIFDEKGNDVEVTVQTIQRADSMEIRGDCGTKSLSPEVGQTETVTCSNPGDVVTVTATYQGHTVVITKYEYHG